MLPTVQQLTCVINFLGHIRGTDDWKGRVMKNNYPTVLSFAAVFLFSVHAVCDESAKIQHLDGDRNAFNGQALSARILLARGDHLKALAELTSIHTHDAEEESTKLILMGLCHETGGDDQSASKLYRRAVQASAKCTVAHLREAVLSYRRGELDHAITMLENYILKDSGNPEAYFYLYVSVADGVERQRYLRRVLELDGVDGFWTKQVVAYREALGGAPKASRSGIEIEKEAEPADKVR